MALSVYPEAAYEEVFAVVSASVFWYPADSALSRPWLRHDEPADDRHPRTEGEDAAARAASLQRAAAAREPDGEAEGNAEAGPA